MNNMKVRSSGVEFQLLSHRYWRIGGEWYDLEPFLKRHPGGSEVLLLGRDRFGDCTYAFEAYHHNFERCRAVLKKYKITCQHLDRPKLTYQNDSQDVLRWQQRNTSVEKGTRTEVQRVNVT